MSSCFPRVTPLVLLAVLSAAFTVGCGGKDNPPVDKGAFAPKIIDPIGEPRPAPRPSGTEVTVKPDRPRPIDNPPSKETPRSEEDPEVLAHIEKKKWSLHEFATPDGKVLKYLHVGNRHDLQGEVTITDEDYRMIARSKTVQVLNLGSVKSVSNKGLETVAGIQQLEGILIHRGANDTGMKALAGCKSLESITLISKNVTDDGIRELAALPKLRKLDLMQLPMNGSAFEVFAGSKTLESITLKHVNGLSDDGVKHLANVPNLRELVIDTRKLDFPYGMPSNKLTTAGIKAIVEKRVPARFVFDSHLLDDDLLETLVKQGWLYGPTPPGVRSKKPATATEVVEIDLSQSKVTDETLKKLSAFKKLNYLSLAKTKVTGAGLEAVAGLPIRQLVLEECELSEAAFEGLGRMAGLQELGLSKAKLKAEWLKHIAALPNLKELNLEETDFNDAAVRHLAALPSLETLRLVGTKLGDAGFQEVLKLPKLRDLSLDRTNVSLEAYRKAKKDYPKLSLSYLDYDLFRP